MKKTWLLWLAVGVLGIVACVFIVQRGCSTYKEVQASLPEPELFSATVIRTYSVDDNGSRYRAYLVNWRGTDVIAEDPLGQTDYKQGETIRVLAIRTQTTKNEITKKHLSFMVRDVGDKR